MANTSVFTYAGSHACTSYTSVEFRYTTAVKILRF